MKLRFGLFLASAIGMWGTATAAGAADVVLPTKAPVVVPDVWWLHGYFEVGGRAFLNDPCRDCTVTSGQGSLAKYYEYSTIKPGAFLDGHVATGSGNGLYQADVWARNVGYSDQQYLVDLSKAGEHYLTFGWDQTPHLTSTSALTLYNGVGTNALTLPAGLSNSLFVASGNTNAVSAANAANVKALIDANVHQTDIGIRRDTASVEYRYTPTDNWDVRADFSNMHRTGTQVEGVVFSPGTSGSRVDAPRPVDDTTRNFGASGEYAGTSPWNQKFNFKLAYGGSLYDDSTNSYTVENPFCPTGAGADGCARPGQLSSPLALMSTEPSNQANMFTATLGMDLPFKSRYMGTLSYNMMRQNAAFLPFTNAVFPGGFPTGWVGNTAAPVNSVADLPRASLNGSINTLLSNNVLTTQITPDLSTKLSYRYYDKDNSTPSMFIPDWVLTDSVSAKARSASYAPVNSLSQSYTKQNGGAQFDWRPSHHWNVGAAFGYERYDWTRADVDVTNEFSGKVFADWKPVSWVTARGSLYYSQRRYQNYDYLNYVGIFQWPSGGSARYSSAYRQLMIDNRDRTKGQFSIAVDVLRGLTVTPNVTYRDDNYLISPYFEEGLNRDRAWTFGIDASYLVNPDTRVLFSYLNEPRSQIVTSAGGSAAPFTNLGAYYSADVKDMVNTYVIGLDQTVIPNKLDLKLSYTWSEGTNSQPLFFANGGIPSAGTGGQYPDVKTNFQRVEAQTKYRFDDDWVRSLGFKGEVFAKVRYAYERNSVQNWQTDALQTYIYSPQLTSVGYMTWLAQDNPNYNVHLIAASLGVKW
jgi:MtrB/PioB family decaheme-associated outer membrane protein